MKVAPRRVRISNPDLGCSLGEILGELGPEVVGEGVDRVLMIGYKRRGRMIAFAALRRRDGVWFDLEGQPLMIEELDR